jgi:hypothetical protein
MAPDTLDSAPTHTRREILWLVVVHVAVAVIVALLMRILGRTDLIVGAAVIGLWIGQMSLLGVWCGLGTTGHWKRLVGGVLGVGILYLWMGVASGDWNVDGLVLPCSFASFVATPFIIARFCRIVVQADSSAPRLASRLIFSIRQLLLLTFVVACVVTLGKVLWPRIPPWLSLINLVIVVGMLILCGVVSTWLILTMKRPVPYGIGLVAMAACAGYCLRLPGLHSVNAIAMTAFTTTSMSVVVVSLLVVRRCGYRLVRLPQSTHRGSGRAAITKPENRSPDIQSSPLSP